MIHQTYNRQGEAYSSLTLSAQTSVVRTAEVQLEIQSGAVASFFVLLSLDSGCDPQLKEKRRRICFEWRAQKRSQADGICC